MAIFESVDISFNFPKIVGIHSFVKTSEGGVHSLKLTWRLKALAVPKGNAFSNHWVSSGKHPRSLTWRPEKLPISPIGKSSTHRIHVWYIYLHLVDFYGKCRWIYHTWILWGSLLPDWDTYQVHYLTRDALMEVIARNRDQCPQLEKTPCWLVRVRRGGSTLWYDVP